MAESMQFNHDRGAEVIRLFNVAAEIRRPYDLNWAQIAERVLPSQDGFIRQRIPGEQHTEKIFDATASLALDRFAAAMESMITPRTKRWHKLTVKDEKLRESQAIKEWLDVVTGLLFSARYHPMANFAATMNEKYRSMGAFGNGVIFIDEIPGKNIVYRSIPLHECYFSENNYGIIDTLYRKFIFTARQAAQAWGKEVLPDKINSCLDTGANPHQKFEFIHAVQPNTEIKWSRKDYKGMAYSSIYVLVDGKQVVSESGYRTFPFGIGRYTTNAGESYAEGPAQIILPDIKQLNAQERDMTRISNMLADPPVLLAEDGVMSLQPRSMNLGMLSADGKPLAVPYQSGGRLDIGIERSEQKRKVINDAFLVSLFQILVESPAMTATEAMLRAQEKGALLAPTMGREQATLSQIIMRELDILQRNGSIPPMPDQMRGAEHLLDVEYTSPLSSMQRAEDGIAIMRTLEAAGSIAQFDQSVIHIIDGEATLRELGEINGIPSKMLRSVEDVAALKQAAAQQAQLQQILQAAPIAAGTAKTMAEAQRLNSQPIPAQAGA